MGEILLRAENIDKHFGITHALDNVSFTFNKGEIHALIGENGSGKSTLTSCLTGIYQKDSGKFILEGKEITATNQVEANHQGVAIIVQEIGTLSGLTVAENIFLGNEDQFTKCGIKNTAAMNKKAQEYLDSYGFNYIDATKVIDDYNFEDRKLVEIVKSTYFNPKVLVVDETTTALGQKGREELFKVMHKVRDTGNCVIFISHDLEEPENDTGLLRSHHPSYGLRNPCGTVRHCHDRLCPAEKGFSLQKCNLLFHLLYNPVFRRYGAHFHLGIQISAVERNLLCRVLPIAYDTVADHSDEELCKIRAL